MPTSTERTSYYVAALRALRFLEHRRSTGRRFGTEADARWAALRGDLTTADRIDLLVRDANAEWPGALGARATFGLRDVAEDDPFGAAWMPLDPVEGEEVWRAVLGEPTPTTVGAGLDAVVRAWGLKLAPFAVGSLTPADRLVVAGPSALAATIAAFAESTDLNWHRQAIVIADAPAARQLAALAPGWLNVNQAVRLLRSDERSDAIAGERSARRALVSDDASADERRAALAHAAAQ